MALESSYVFFSQAVGLGWYDLAPLALEGPMVIEEWLLLEEPMMLEEPMVIEEWLLLEESMVLEKRLAMKVQMAMQEKILFSRAIGVVVVGSCCDRPVRTIECGVDLVTS